MLEQELKDLVDILAVDYKAIIGMIGNLSTLPADVTKTNLVAALTSLNTKIANAAGINDAVTATGSTWSSNKIQGSIDAAVAALVDGAPAALDTLRELAAQMTADASMLDTIAVALGKRVRVDQAQTFTPTEQQQALDNIGGVSKAQLGNPSFDLAAYYTQKKSA
ncbi:hypothetical protein M0L20_18145 [Spirosoma sp. RP8]|uniref:Uncharacterized protein n=1 Tax=Spirosoma liriopis TaxID=2937440 RepID=A0ABT0HQ68_9BACT|nr:hypothetical protein [Spirosoma liriopis]MCK8493793.1 hypothetical protein [Spirosoma liriopis]